MGSDSTSKFEVKNTKSEKMKRKNKSKDVTNKTNSDDTLGKNDANVKQDMKHKKRKEKKRKANETSTEVIKNNITSAKESLHEVESSDEITPPKKKASICIENDLDDAEETDKSNAKTPKQPSKRQLKREKAEKLENEKRMASKMDAMKKGLSYVSKWKHARSEWKFEKLRQIWLIDNLLDETSIPDDIFPTVLEYFEGCRGMAREQLLKKGMDVMRKVEEDEENKEELESIAYQRARKLLQALPTET